MGASGGTENWLYGTAVTYTSAPCTGLPLQAETRYRITMVSVEPPITDGETSCRSMRSLTGGASSATGITPVPGLSQPVVEGGGGGVAASRITAVGTDVAVVRPSAFCAVTRTRSVLP